MDVPLIALFDNTFPYAFPSGFIPASTILFGFRRGMEFPVFSPVITRLFMPVTTWALGSQ